MTDLEDTHVILWGGQLLYAIPQRARTDCTEAVAIRSQFTDVGRSVSWEGKEPDCDPAIRSLDVRLQSWPPEANKMQGLTTLTNDLQPRVQCVAQRTERSPGIVVDNDPTQSLDAARRQMRCH